MSNQILSDTYDYIGEYHEGLAFAREKSLGKAGYINENGEVVIPIEYEYMKDNRYFVFDYFSEGLAALYKDGKLGFVDKTGAIAIDFQYDYAYAFQNGVCPVKKDEFYGIIDRHGNTVVSFEYEMILPYGEYFAYELFAAIKDGKVVGLNKYGEVEIPFSPVGEMYDFRGAVSEPGNE
jgi:hypothetical protein